MPVIRIALAQTNPVVGDLNGNLRMCLERVETAAQNGASIVVFPGMVASGYPIEDLATRESFLNDAVEAVKQFAIELNERGLGEQVVHELAEFARTGRRPDAGWTTVRHELADRAYFKRVLLVASAALAEWLQPDASYRDAQLVLRQALGIVLGPVGPYTRTLASKRLSLEPCTGGNAIDATSRPGNCTSMA